MARDFIGLKYQTGQTKAVYGGLLFLIIGCFGVWMLPVMRGIIFPPDEYGYWANAAVMLGYDWTEVNRLNPYYSYGYSLILTPLLKIGEEISMTFSYRLAIAVNLLFVWIHGMLLWKIVRRLFTRMDEKKCVIICLCGALYPSVLVYMQYTFAETMLNMVFLWLVWRVVLYAEAIENSGNMSVRATWLAVAAGILYITHMRTIGIWLSLAVAVVTEAFLCKNKEECQETDSVETGQGRSKHFSKKQKAALLFIGLSIALFLGAEVIKELLQEKLYGGTGLAIMKVNDYGGQMERLVRLFTLSGFLDFWVSCAGKLFYLGNTTFGLYYFALALLWRKCIDRKEKHKLVWRFIFGAAILNFGVSALGMSGTERVDGLLYGRYNETVVPLLVCLGIVEIFRQRELWKKAVGIAAFHGFLLGIVSVYTSVKELTIWLPDFTVGIAYAAGQKPDNVRQIFMRPYVAGLVGIAFLFFTVWMIQKRKKAFYWLGMLSAAYLTMAMIISLQNIRPHQRDNLGDMQITKTILELQQNEPGREVWLLHSEWNEYADSLQFFLPEQQIHVISQEEADIRSFGERDLLVTYKNDNRNENLGLRYRMSERSWHMNLYYNP